jgi:hypothetical protein
MSPPAHASCRCLGPGERSSVTSEPSSLIVVGGYFFIHFPWVAGHVVTSEPSHARRWGPVPQDALWLRSPSSREAGSGCHGTCGGPGALRAGRWGLVPRGGAGAFPCREAGSRVAGHVATPEPSRTGRLGPVLQDTRQCIVACPASHHSF